MNKIILTGRLTKDVETRYSQSAEPIAITRISIAVSRKYKKENEANADFINCTAFGKTAEFISKYFRKGQAISIVGEIRSNSWKDNQGQKRYSTEILIQEVEFVGSKSENEKIENNEDENCNLDKDNNFYNIETEVNEDNLRF